MSETTPYPIDKGGVFDSDIHRRVCGHLPHDDGDPATADSITVPDLCDRLNVDADSLARRGKFPNVELVPWIPEELEAILNALEVDGYAVKNAPAGEEAPPTWTASSQGIAALTGPALTHPEAQPDGTTVMVEPPPMEGARLEQAEAVNAAAAEEAEAYERQAAADRVTRAEAELEAAKANAKEVGKP